MPINSFITPEAAPNAEILVEEGVEEGGSFLHEPLKAKYGWLRGSDVIDDLHARNDGDLTILRHENSFQGQNMTNRFATQHLGAKVAEVMVS